MPLAHLRGSTQVVARRLARRLGRSLRERVAGSDADAAATRIWGSEGERWFTPDDPMWRVQDDAAMFPAGVAALLLQSLHPAAMAGVAGHSGYRGDPWGRLQRTSHYLATVSFGTIEHATETIEHVRSIHERVRGVDEDGVPYRASDPHLLLWVHVAEIWCFLQGYQRYAPTPLSPAEADTYVAQAAIPARLLGVTDPPTTVAELEACLQSYRPELRASAAARDAAAFLLKEPPLPLAARGGYALIAVGGVALLPDWAAEELRLPVTRPIMRAAALGVGRVGAGAVRWGLAGLRETDPHRPG